MHDAKLLEKELGSRLRRLFVSRRFGAVKKNNRQITAMRRAGNGVSLQWPKYISQMRVPKARNRLFAIFLPDQCRTSVCSRPPIEAPTRRPDRTPSPGDRQTSPDG